MKTAHAVYDINRQELFSNSVHDTPQGAMVNGLLLCFGILAQQGWDYKTIRHLWITNAKVRYCIVRVDLTTDGHAVKL